MAITTWNIDAAHTSIQFAVRHLLVARVRGRFGAFGGAVHLDEDNILRSEVELRIDAASIDTGFVDRDAHLCSPDFLDAESHPELRFRSKQLERIEVGHYRLVGDLTLRGVARELALDVEYGGRARDPWGHERAGFTARGALDRRQFGLVWNQVLETGGVLVGDRIELEIDLECVRRPAPVD